MRVKNIAVAMRVIMSVIVMVFVVVMVFIPMMVMIVVGLVMLFLRHKAVPPNPQCSYYK
jgi:hypothetical protein